jgi:hypothetical protein
MRRFGNKPQSKSAKKIAYKEHFTNLCKLRLWLIEATFDVHNDVLEPLLLKMEVSRMHSCTQNQSFLAAMFPVAM